MKIGAVGTTLKLMDGFTTPMQKVFSSLDTMFQALEKVNSSSKNLELDKAMKEARGSVEIANEALIQMGQSLQDVEQKSDKLFNSLHKYIGIGATFEAGRRAFMSNMNYDDASRQAMAIMGDGSMEMIQQMDRYTSAFTTGGLSKKDIAEGYQFTSLAGWNFDESTFAMPVMRDVQRVTGADFGVISDLITDSMTPLGLSINQLPDFADQMATTQNISNTNMKQLLEAYQSGGFKGVQTGKMSIPELNTFIGVLANAGIKGSDAGTQVRNIVNGLYDTSSKTKAVLDGMNIATYKDGEAVNAFDILQEFGTKLNAYDDESKKSIMSDLFNVYDEVGLNALMMQLDKLPEYKMQIEESGGALQDMIDIIDGGAGGAFRNFLSQFNIWISGIGSALEPVAMVMFAFMQTDFAGTVFGTIELLAGGMGLLATVFMMLFSVMDPLTPLIWGLVGAIGALYMAKNIETIQTKFQTTQTMALISAKFMEIAAQKGKLSAILLTIPILMKEAVLSMWKVSKLLTVITVVGTVIVVLVALAQKFDWLRVGMVKAINGIIIGVNFLLEQIAKIPILGDKIGNFRIKQLDEQTALKFNNPFNIEMPELPNSDDFSGQIPDLSFPEKFNIGNVDRVGRVDSNREVNISDEDIRLMRDVAMKEALVQYNTFKLEQSNTFGDIRETADVDGVIDRMKEMLEEEVAVSGELSYTI